MEEWLEAASSFSDVVSAALALPMTTEPSQGVHIRTRQDGKS